MVKVIITCNLSDSIVKGLNMVFYIRLCDVRKFDISSVNL